MPANHRPEQLQEAVALVPREARVLGRELAARLDKNRVDRLQARMVHGREQVVDRVAV